MNENLMLSNQGRIQDFKLGVAQMDWKKWKGGGLNYFKYDYYSIEISNTILIKHDLFNIFVYILSPLYNILIKKKRIWKDFRGGARPVRPL